MNALKSVADKFPASSILTKVEMWLQLASKTFGRSFLPIQMRNKFKQTIGDKKGNGIKGKDLLNTSKWKRGTFFFDLP
jgi:hypothetical protein